MTEESIKRVYEIPVRHTLTPDAGQVVIVCRDLLGDAEESSAALIRAAERSGNAWITFDFPAHGASTVAENQLTVPNCLEDMTAVYDFVKKTSPEAQISLFGTGFGAAIALLWVSAQNKKAVRPVKNVVAYGAAVCMHTLLENMAGGEEGVERWRKSGTLKTDAAHPAVLPFGLLRDFERYDVFQQFRRGKETYLFFHGTEDQVAAPDDIKRFTHLYHLTLTEVPGAGHAPDASEAERVAFEAAGFLF